MVSGKIEKNEVINFEMDLFTGHNEIYDINLIFENTPADVEAMVHDCTDSNTLVCQLDSGSFGNANY